MPPLRNQIPASRPRPTSSERRRPEVARREVRGGASGDWTPRGWGKGQGAAPLTSFPGSGYISGARGRCCCCCSSHCSTRAPCRELAGGSTDRRKHAKALRPQPRAGATAARPRPPVQPPLARCLGARPHTASCSAPGSAMRSAAVLALLLCAGQGERERGARGRGSRAPLPTLRSGHRAAPSAPPHLPSGAASFQHRGQRRRLPPDPAVWPLPGTHRTLGPDSQPRGARPPCAHPLSGLGASATSGPVPVARWPAKVIRGGGRMAARTPPPLFPFHLTLPSFLPLTSTSPYHPSQSPSSISSPPPLGSLPSPHVSPTPVPLCSPWPCFDSAPCSRAHQLQSRSFPRGRGRTSPCSLWGPPHCGQQPGKGNKISPSLSFWWEQF